MQFLQMTENQKYKQPKQKLGKKKIKKSHIFLAYFQIRL
jgi:hypothetical protein